MKKTLIAAAAGALGALGAAGLMAAAPASAGPASCDALPIGGGKIACLTNDQVMTFGETISPGYNLNVLINGTVGDDGNRSGLGLRDQPTTFLASVGDFLNGPTNPDPPAPAAGFDTPAPGTPAP